MSGRVPPRTPGARSGRDTDCAAQATRTPSGPPGRCSRVAAPNSMGERSRAFSQTLPKRPDFAGLSRYTNEAILTEDCALTAVFGQAGCDLRNRRSRVRIAPGASRRACKAGFLSLPDRRVELAWPQPTAGAAAPVADDRATRAQRVELLALAVGGEAQLAGDRP